MNYERLVFYGMLGVAVGKIFTITKYDNLIREVSNFAGNQPALIKAIIKVESNFNELSSNESAREKSYGLGQINILAFPQYNKAYLMVPENNIRVVNEIVTAIKKGHKDYSVPDIFSHYNAGHLAVNADGSYINNEYVMKMYAYYLLYTVFTLGGVIA